MAELALALSESLVLPFEITNYAKFLQMDLSKLESRYSAILHDNGASFGFVLFCIFIQWIFFNLNPIYDSEYFRKAVDHFQNATDYFVQTVLPQVDVTK